MGLFQSTATRATVPCNPEVEKKTSRPAFNSFRSFSFRLKHFSIQISNFNWPRLGPRRAVPSAEPSGPSPGQLKFEIFTENSKRKRTKKNENQNENERKKFPWTSPYLNLQGGKKKPFKNVFGRARRPGKNHSKMCSVGAGGQVKSLQKCFR